MLPKAIGCVLTRDFMGALYMTEGVHGAGCGRGQPVWGVEVL